MSRIKYSEKIGEVISHKGDEFRFRASSRLKTGQFISYYEDMLGSEILCKVISTSTTPDNSGIVADGKVIGAFDPELNEFIHPRFMPSIGVSVSLADAEILSHVSKVKRGEIGSAFLGTIYGTEQDVCLSVRDVVSQHLSVIAATGSGKSYAVGGLVEEMLMPNNSAPVLILDPHGEYLSLQEASNDVRFRATEYHPKVKVVHPESIKLRFDEFTMEEMVSIMDADGSMSGKMKVIFRSAYLNLKADRKRPFIRDELKREVVGMKTEDNESSVEGIMWRLNVFGAYIFDDYEHIPLSEYFRVGQLTILDLSGIADGFQQLIAMLILKMTFEYRRGTERGEYVEGDHRYLPFPVFIVLEEAHRFSPQEGQARSKGILKTILSEGRKFGVGVCMVSQRPSRLDSDSLSQCMTQLFLKVINPADQEQISRSVETMSRDLIEDLPNLAKGQGIVSGVGINVPTLINIRQKYTRDALGIDLPAPEIWQKNKETQEKKEIKERIRPDDDVIDLGF